MRRVLACLIAFSAAGTALADIGPPPGIKRIPYEARLLVEKEFSDYLFFAVSGGDKATVLKLDAKTPATIKAGGGRYRQAELVAVPAAAAKSFDTEKGFHSAVAKGKVDGLIRAKKSFYAFSDVKEADPRKSIVEEFKIVKVDEKGIVLEAVKAAKDESKNAPEEEGEGLQTVTQPQGRWIAAGIAASLALALAGLRLAGLFTRRAK